MITSALWATALRVLAQIRRDHRTLALVLLVPVLLLSLVKWVFDGQPHVFQRVGIPMVGVFPLVSMFLVTSVTMLRERVTGTLERLMTMPLTKLDILAGYALGFGLIAFVQGVLLSAVAFLVLDLEAEGGWLLVVLLAVLNALLGMSLGLLVSAFARTEFEAVQFMPAFLLPQFILSGILLPRSEMLPALEALSNVLPMTYGYDALERARDSSGFDARLLADAVAVVAVTVGVLVLAAFTLRRRTD
jgi:ABC-2 type transport system permease protein